VPGLEPDLVSNFEGDLLSTGILRLLFLSLKQVLSQKSVSLFWSLDHSIRIDLSSSVVLFVALGLLVA